MNCTEARASLPDLLYRELPPGDVRELELHLTACPSCRRQADELAATKSLLDGVPAPNATVDLAQLYRQAADQEAGRTRRWRRATITALGLAASLLLAFLLLRLEVRLEPHQMTLRWGVLPAAAAPVSSPHEPSRPLPVEDLRLAKDLIHALAADVEARDNAQQEALLRLQQRFEGFQMRAGQLWAATDRDLSALYAAQFGSRPIGENP